MKSHRSRRAAAVVVCLVAATVATIGLGSTANAEKASGEPLKFGYVDPFPGFQAQPGIVQALQAYVDDWNKRGGQNGQPIDIVFKTPGAYSPTEFIATVNQMASQDKVIAFMSPGVCQFTISALRALRLPTWGASDTCGKDDSFMFSPAAGAPTLPYLKYAISKGKKVFAVMYPGAIAGLKEGFVDPLARYLDHHPEIKTKLVEIKQPFPASAADIDGAIAEMKSEGVDALFVATQPEGGALTMQQAKLQGVGPDTGILWMFGPNFYDPKVAESPDLEGTYVLSTNYPWEDTKNAEVKKMIKVTKGKVEKKDGFAIGGYASGALLERSLKGMKGKITSEALQAHWKTLTKVTAPLTPMKISFTGLNKNPSGGVILKFDNGEYVPVSDFITVPGKEFAP